MDAAGNRAVAVLNDRRTSRSTTDGGHDIGDVQVRQVENGFVVLCACGWASHRHGLALHAAEEWQRHRSA